ncbi:MAG: T9SS type A sorting domain-containing protein [Bacteroidales bacterium]|nr:T9SS type A sorting domain-containing protein [Bacteroidales bacterium]
MRNFTVPKIILSLVLMISLTSTAQHNGFYNKSDDEKKQIKELKEKTANLPAFNENQIKETEHDFTGMPLKSGDDLGEPLDHDWSKQLGETGPDHIHEMVTDQNDNIYVSGTFSGEVEMDGDTYNSPGYENGFVLKLNESGEFQWFVILSTEPTEKSTIDAIEVDNTGNLYVSGSYTGEAQLNEYDLPSQSTTTAFIAHMMPDATVDKDFSVDADDLTINSENELLFTDSRYIKKITSNDELVTENVLPWGMTNLLIEDGEDCYYVTGRVYAQVEIGDFTLEPNGDNNIFTAEFNPSHECEWATMPEGGSSTYVSNLSMRLDDTENIFLSGNVWGTLNFEGNEISYGQNFVAKCNTNGFYEWATPLDAVGNLSVSDNVYVSSGNTLSAYSLNGILNETYEFANNIEGLVAGSDGDFSIGLQAQQNLVVSSSSGETNNWNFNIHSTYNNARIFEMVDDNDGYLYSLGYVTGDIGYLGYNGTGTYFIARHNSDGNLIWKHELPEELIFEDYISLERQIALSPDGEYLYLVGGFEETIEIGEQSISPETDGYSTGPQNTLIAKFDDDGNVIWLENMTLPAQSTSYPSIAVNDNKFYVAGTYEGEKTVHGNDMISNGIDDVYIACYDVDGNFNWIGTAGGEWHEYMGLVSTDASGNAYLTGEFTSHGEVDFLGTTFTAEQADGHVYLSKISPEGNVQWLHRYGADAGEYEGKNDYCWPTDIIATDDGYTYLKGWYRDGVTFGDIYLENPIETSYGIGYFIGKFHPDGSPEWVEPIPEKYHGFDYNNMDIDNQGNVYFGAEATDTLYFADELYAPQKEDLFVAKYTTDGEFAWAKTMEGNGNNDIVSVCAMDTSAIFYSGLFRDKLNFGGELHVSPISKSFISMLGSYEVHGVEGLSETAVEVYPNPTTTGIINILNKEKNEYLVKVYDALGKKVMEQKIRERKQSIDIGHLPKGTYILSITSENLTGVKKVVYR